jgi:ureidoglycolate dehydrogenase (NAD+)
VTNSNHFGTAAYYTERASSQGHIGISMTNVDSDVIPFGGTEAFLGTNPISFSIPTDRSFPITLDMATSVVARGKIEHAAKEGEDLPEDWAVDENNEPATNPEDVVAMRPLGGPKGFGLGIVGDVLWGVLTGGGTSPSIKSLYEDFEESMGLGHFVGAIDVTTFRAEGSFLADIDAYIDRLKSQPTREGVKEIRLPGELEAITKRDNERDGIPLNEDARRGIRNLIAATIAEKEHN